jgi:murein DD-endopeptidase MepM/ murein hydrolase activator NlpD
MKFAAFLAGVVIGTLATYLVLTQVWWPDVRLPADRNIMVATAAPTVSAPPAAPPTPQGFGSPEAQGPPEAFASPLASAPAEAPPVVEVASTPPPTPPFAMRLDLPILSTDLDRLKARDLLIPVSGIKAASLHDAFAEDRGARRHDAIDIMAPRGTPVMAVEDGRLEKLFTSKQGGLTVYQFDPGGQYCYYYAHLDKYAAGLAQGAALHKGDVIGYVGSTGNASPEAPHLHFTIFRLGPEKHWWEGTAINPFPLWSVTPAS